MMSGMFDDGGPPAPPDGPRLPGGTAPAAGFARADDLVAAMIGATLARLEAAIAERLWRQELSDRGDAAATLFLDAARLRALLQGAPGDAPPEVARLRATAERRERSLLRRLQQTGDGGAPLARAIARFRLAPDAVRVLAAGLAGELSPRVARLAAFAGGDASRPGITGEALGALLGADAAGVAAAARQLAPGAPLCDLALALLRPADAPLLRRQLWIAPRLVDLALGREALDPAVGAALVPPPPPGAIAAAGSEAGAAARAAVAAVLRRPREPVAGLIRGSRGAALARLARLLADAGACLLVVELSILADDTRLAALAREAVLLGAAIAVRADVTARDAPRAARAIDRLAALAPVFVASAGEPEPALELGVGAIALELPAPGRAELAAAVDGAFAGLLTADEVARVAAHAPLDLGSMQRAAAAIAAQPFPADRAAAVIRALADQHAVPVGSAARPLVARAAPPPAAAAALDAAARRWAASPLPRRLRVVIDGRAGAGKSAAAAALAARLGLPAFEIDPPRPGRGSEPDPALAHVAAAVAMNAAVLVVDNVDLLGARRARAAGEPAFTLGWIGRLDGLVIVTTRDPLSNLEPALRRELDLAISLPGPERDGPEGRLVPAGSLALGGDLGVDRALDPTPTHE
jgi:hypothetical protein